MQKICFETAQNHNNELRSCRLFQKDVIDLLWAKFDFVETIKKNKMKFTFIYSNMKLEKFELLTKSL